MLPRALDYLRCPVCLGTLRILEDREFGPSSFDPTDDPPGCGHYCGARGQERRTPTEGPCDECWTQEIDLGLLECSRGHVFPVLRGIPRMDPGALVLHRELFEGRRSDVGEVARRALASLSGTASDGKDQFKATKRSFSMEWDLWQPGDQTWIWDLESRKKQFAQEIDLPSLDTSRHLVLLDAGCGNGQLAAGIAQLGFEVFAIDLSFSVERAHAIKTQVAGARARYVHYIQANLMQPPFAPESFDVVYSAGVLHHTPNTERAFRKVLALTKPRGKGFSWLYCARRKPFKWLMAKLLRVFTVHMPPKALMFFCLALSWPIKIVTTILTKLRIRETAYRTHREFAVSLFDEFSPRYQFHHTEKQVQGWFASLGFTGCTVTTFDRNGFGMTAIRAGRDGARSPNRDE